MCCLVVVFLWFGPRISLFLLWLFGERLSHAFDSFWTGFLGWVFLPFTTFFWAMSHSPSEGVTGFGWILVALGVLLDLGTWFGGGRVGAERYPQAR
jgi:hypothetical protein